MIGCLNILDQDNLIKRFIINNNITYREFKESPLNLEYKKDLINNNEGGFLTSTFAIFTSNKDKNDYLLSRNLHNHNIDVYDINNNKLFKSLEGHKGQLSPLRYFYNIKENLGYIISADNAKDKVIIVWDDREYSVRYRIETKYKGEIKSILLLFNIEGKNYIIASSNNEDEFIRLYECSNTCEFKNIPKSNNVNTCYLQYWFYNNNHYILEHIEDSLRIINIFNEEIYHEFKYNNAKPRKGSTFGSFYNNQYYILSTFEKLIMYDLINKNIYKNVEIKGILY